MVAKYKRVLLKLSGESLAGKAGHGIDFDTVLNICKPVKELVDMGVEVAIVVGGGNFWRGRSSGSMDRTRADHMGMLATVINALGVADGLEQLGLDVRVQTAIAMQEVAEPYIRNRAVRHLEKGRVVVFGCGTGNPFFSTDTGAALRAAEIEADVILKATMVDGVYDSDPKSNPNAQKYDTLSYMDVLNKVLHGCAQQEPGGYGHDRRQLLPGQAHPLPGVQHRGPPEHRPGSDRRKSRHPGAVRAPCG